MNTNATRSGAGSIAGVAGQERVVDDDEERQEEDAQQLERPRRPVLVLAAPLERADVERDEGDAGRGQREGDERAHHSAGIRPIRPAS
ncbi:MAG: hypothetical protein H6710_00450 [Myxococcales bacterium]|nr:hypothetical protein [Myxococcales bacterium]